MFYRSASGKLMAAPVRAGLTFQSGTPVELFDLRGAIIAPHTNGRRFLAEFPSPALGQEPLQVVLNWAKALPATR